MALAAKAKLAGTGAPCRRAFSGKPVRVVPRVVCKATNSDISRRHWLQEAAVLGAALTCLPKLALAEEAPVLLCDGDCAARINSAETVTTASGLQYKDLVVGTGPQPITGYQILVNYVAMNPQGRVFENSLEKGPFDIRVGAGQVIPGLDEGLSTMKVGGIRRLYIPGSLAFPKNLRAAAGRPSIQANTPVVFDVQLLYIPGLSDDE